MGFDEVIDLSAGKLGEGVRCITEGYGSDIVIDAIGGDVLSEALGTLAIVATLYSAGLFGRRKSTIVTDLIWKRASIKSFALFQPPEMWRAAWKAICALLESGAIKLIVARTFVLEDAVEALRYQIDSRPFGRVVLKIKI